MGRARRGRVIEVIEKSAGERGHMTTMSIERALEITAQCVRNRVSITLGDDYEPLPAVSLHDMLEANRLVRDAGTVNNGDGTYTVRTTCDQRALAASYAFEQYGRSPAALLEAVGYALKPASAEEG